MGRSARRGWSIAGLFTMGAALGCGNPGVPGGQGNDVIDDTRDAEPRPPPNPDPPPADGAAPTGEPDGAFYADGYAPDGPPVATYPGASACSTCSCASTVGYCFGGATARMPFAGGDAGGGDGGLPACPMLAAGAPGVGCNPLPASCKDCACIIAALQPSYACYLVCANDGAQMTVYCPNP